MKIENQVCSLELAKKLKELGVKQESYFLWNIPLNTILEPNQYPKSWTTTDGVGKNFASAFTVAELGELLPITLTQSRLNCQKLRGKWWRITYGTIEITDDTLADAMASMLIYLLKNNLVKVEDL